MDFAGIAWRSTTLASENRCSREVPPTWCLRMPSIATRINPLNCRSGRTSKIRHESSRFSHPSPKSILWQMATTMRPLSSRMQRVGHQKRGSRENLFGSKHRLQSCRVEQRSSGPTTGDPVDKLECGSSGCLPHCSLFVTGKRSGCRCPAIAVV